MEIRTATAVLNTQRVLETVHVTLQLLATMYINTDPVQHHHLHHRVHQIIRQLVKSLQFHQMNRHTFQVLNHHLNHR